MIPGPAPRGDVRRALDDVCDLFPPDVQARGVNRGYFDYRWTLEAVTRRLRTVADARVLDLGAGAGVVPLALSRLGARTVAFDTYAEYAAACDNQMGAADQILERFRRHGVAPVIGSLQPHALPFAAGTFDAVLLLAVIEHLHESPKRLLAEIVRVLKPGGLFFVTTPNIGWVRTRLRLLAGRTVHYPIDEWYESPRFFGHIREYTLDELRTMLRWAGMEVIEARYGNSTHLSTRLRGDGSRWHRGFRVNSLRRLIEAGSIAVSAAVPSLRYAMLAVARKPERDR